MILDYFELIKPWESELIGVMDGTSQATVVEKGFINKGHYKKFAEVFANPNHFSSKNALESEFELECVKLKRNAKITDFLSFAPMSNILVSDRVYQILVKYNLGQHKFYNAIVEDTKGNKVEGYRFFYQEILEWDIIDFPSTQFVKGNKFDGYKPIYIKSKEEFMKDRFVNVEKLALNFLPKGFDMFKVKIPLGNLVSSSLYEELSKINVTGMKFKSTKIEVKETNI